MAQILCKCLHCGGEVQLIGIRHYTVTQTARETVYYEDDIEEILVDRSYPAEAGVGQCQSCGWNWQEDEWEGWNNPFYVEDMRGVAKQH